jgi:glycopeptide antibiotics resistance protein
MTKRLIPLALLLIYSALLLKVMVLKDVPLIRLGMLKLNFGGTLEGPANFIPFKTIIQYLHADKGVLIAAINILGNIFLLVPFGFLVAASFSNITWLKKITLAFTVGFLIEGMQVVLHIGIFDIDDVILNGMGVIVGYWKYGVFQQLFPSTRSKIIFFATVLLIVIAFFGIYFYRNGKFPIGFQKAVIHKSSDLNESGDLDQGGDPCNGTGGTGEIIGVQNQSITIKRKDGVNQLIKITAQTIIKNSILTIPASDLKIGQRVTLIIDETETASLVLVCNESF